LIRRIALVAAAPVAAIGAAFAALVVSGPVADRLARKLMAAPRRLPREAGLAPAIDALGGEVVALRARDGVQLAGRWLPCDTSRAADGWVPDAYEAILLLHGWNGSVAPDLVEYGPFLRSIAGVLALDFRGHGASGDGPTTFGLLEVEDVAGALAWLGVRGIRRVALVGSSMGGITALAALGVLGDGRLTAADADAAAPAAQVEAPRPRITAVVADAVAPRLVVAVGSRISLRAGGLIAARAFSRFPKLVGGDPRATEPMAVIGLVEDVPVLLVHGDADDVVPLAEGQQLADAAPAGVRHLVITGAAHGKSHTVDPAAWEAAAAEVLKTGFTAARG